MIPEFSLEEASAAVGEDAARLCDLGRAAGKGGLDPVGVVAGAEEPGAVVEDFSIGEGPPSSDGNSPGAEDEPLDGPS